MVTCARLDAQTSLGAWADAYGVGVGCSEDINLKVPSAASDAVRPLWVNIMCGIASYHGIMQLSIM